jgi:hypothetical protein
LNLDQVVISLGKHDDLALIKGSNNSLIHEGATYEYTGNDDETRGSPESLEEDEILAMSWASRLLTLLLILC